MDSTATTTATKTCRRCGIARPLDEYYVRRGRPLTACRFCHIAHATATRARRQIPYLEGRLARARELAATLTTGPGSAGP